jgi:hypothetical protein
MSNDNYASRIGMPVLQIDVIKKTIFEDIRRSIEKDLLDDKQCFHIVGPAGVGKTQIVFQIAEQLSDYFKKDFDIKKINAPVLTRDDFLSPYPSSDTQFKMLYSDYIPEVNSEYGIFVIDECTRGDQQLQQMMWQIQNENQLHTYKFPKGWFVITIDNPDDDNYQINNMEDAAGIRRCLHMYTKVSSSVFLTHAKSQKFHPHVISYIQKYPDKIYDFESQKSGKIYANPASWEKVSNHLYKYNDDFSDNIIVFEMLCAGLLNVFGARHFCDHLKDLQKVIISGEDIWNRYPKVRTEINDMVSKKQNNQLYEILSNFINYLIEEQPEPKATRIYNVLAFLQDLPMDIAAGFVTHLAKLQMGSKEHLYLMSLMVAMNTESEDFKKNFFDKLLNLGS